MNIGFTGHRDRLCNVAGLDELARQYPFATWVHGGAEGFDTQVQRYAVEHGIETRVIRPDYNQFGQGAPLVRNRQIVDTCDFLVACYDGRMTGGTFYTVQYAQKHLKTVVFIRLAPKEGE